MNELVCGGFRPGGVSRLALHVEEGVAVLMGEVWDEGAGCFFKTGNSHVLEVLPFHQILELLFLSLVQAKWVNGSQLSAI